LCPLFLVVSHCFPNVPKSCETCIMVLLFVVYAYYCLLFFPKHFHTCTTCLLYYCRLCPLFAIVSQTFLNIATPARCVSLNVVHSHRFPSVPTVFQTFPNIATSAPCVSLVVVSHCFSNVPKHCHTCTKCLSCCRCFPLFATVSQTFQTSPPPQHVSLSLLLPIVSQ